MQDGDPEEGFIWFENIFDNLFQENVDKTDAATSTQPTSTSSDIFDSGDVAKSGSTAVASSLGDTDTTKLMTMESDQATTTTGQPTMDLQAELSVFDAR